MSPKHREKVESSDSIKDLLKNIHNPWQAVVALLLYVRIKRRREMWQFLFMVSFFLNLFLTMRFTTWLETLFKSTVKLVMWSIGM